VSHFHGDLSTTLNFSHSSMVGHHVKNLEDMEKSGANAVKSAMAYFQYYIVIETRLLLESILGPSSCIEHSGISGGLGQTEYSAHCEIWISIIFISFLLPDLKALCFSWS
jgi:hypothetical protein